MPTDQREVKESPLDQGVREKVSYSFDFSAAGVDVIEGTPTVLMLTSGGVDVTATTLPGGASGTVTGRVATTGRVQALIDGQLYMLYCRVTHDGGQVAELLCKLRGRA